MHILYIQKNIHYILWIIAPANCELSTVLTFLLIEFDDLKELDLFAWANGPKALGQHRFCETTITIKCGSSPRIQMMFAKSIYYRYANQK